MPLLQRLARRSRDRTVLAPRSSSARDGARPWVVVLVLLTFLTTSVSRSSAGDLDGTVWNLPAVNSTLKFEVKQLDQKGKAKTALSEVVLTIVDSESWSLALDDDDTISGTYKVKTASAKVEVWSLKLDPESLDLMQQRYENEFEDLLGIPVTIKKLKFKVAKVTFKQKNVGMVATLRLKPEFSSKVEVGGSSFTAKVKVKVTGKSDAQAL